MQTISPSQASLLSSLAFLCDEGRRHFLTAARTAEDIPTRAICLQKGRHCEEMAAELRARIESRGGDCDAGVGIPDIFSRQKTQLIRCMNWRSGAVQRYELALRRPSLEEDDRLLLRSHLQWLEDTGHHLATLAATSLAAA